MYLPDLLPLLIQAGYFISAFAAIAAGFIMRKTTSKFGKGSLEEGFKTISIGVFCIAAGILVDAFQSYFQGFGNVSSVITLFVKEALFVTGTYTIVVGSKKTVDKLESLSK